MGASNLIYLATMYGSHWNGIDSAICRISAIYRRPSQLIASPIPTLAINGSCLPYPPPCPHLSRQRCQTSASCQSVNQLGIIIHLLGAILPRVAGFLGARLEDKDTNGFIKK